MMRKRLRAWMAAVVLCGGGCVLGAVPGDCRQLVVAVADDWGSQSGRMQMFSRERGGWVANGPAVKVVFSRNGLGWGRGLHVVEPDGRPRKVERDKRTPAGVFRIGTIFTYDSALPEGADYPFRTIGRWDAWVDDPQNPYYNRHFVAEPGRAPEWFEKQRMRLDDPPHRWLIEIRHNADPPVAGAGSAIFFHMWRGPWVLSSGCTVMDEAAMRSLIGWLRASQNPHYVLLPREEYLARFKAWKLPSPEIAAAVLGLPKQ